MADKPSTLEAGHLTQTGGAAATIPIGRGVAVALAFAVLTFVGANIYIPIQPVPVTLQTLFVLLAGAVAGRGFGAGSQLLYVGAGAMGLPVFAEGAVGMAVLAGPTGGYIAGFVAAPLVVGALIHRRSSIAWQALVFSIGTLVIFALGVAHLSVSYTHSFAEGLRLGLLPFVPGAFIKIAAAVSIYRSYSALVRQYRARRSG